MAASTPSSDPIIHCIGESHACFFSGLRGLHDHWPAPVVHALPGIASYRIGHFLAHSLTKPRHPARSLLTKLLRAIPTRDPILLCFGEIDCRNHVIKQAHTQQRAIEEVARDLATRYARAARALTRSRLLAFWATPPTNDARVPNPEYPTVGSFVERRRATLAFNAALAAAAATLDAAFLDITRAITTRAGHQRPEFFCDQVHLAPKALPAAVEALINAGLASTDEHARGLTIAARALSLVPAPLPPPQIIAAHAPDPLTLPPHASTHEQIKAALINNAALTCRVRGYRRIALYGAGRHTREMRLAPFERAGVRVVRILDDAPNGDSLLGVPLVQTAHARAGFDAVLISSDAHEDSMADLALAIFKPRGVPVLRIYAWQLND